MPEDTVTQRRAGVWWALRHPWLGALACTACLSLLSVVTVESLVLSGRHARWSRIVAVAITEQTVSVFVLFAVVLNLGHRRLRSQRKVSEPHADQ
jgi:hypothetical protein